MMIHLKHPFLYAVFALPCFTMAACVIKANDLNGLPTGSMSYRVIGRGDIEIHGHKSVVYEQQFGPGAGVSMHTHDGEEIGYIMGGSIHLIMEGGSKKLSSGESYVVGPRVAHALQTNDSGASLIVISILEKDEGPFIFPMRVP